MQKVTAFLEQHVQWVAIALGALFCLFMIYSYVITPPAEVTIGSESYGPSEVDPHTAETVVTKLQTAMQNNAKIKMEVPQYVQSFQDAMTWKGAKPVEIVRLTDPALTLDVLMPLQPPGPNGATVGPVTPGGPGVSPTPAPIPGAKITQLPVPPTPRQLDPVTAVKYGRSVVVPAPAPGQAAVVPQPGIVPPGAVDTDWVTQMWTISMNDIDTAFRNAGMQNIPPELRKTMFLQVEMIREEQVDGKWQNATVMPHRGPTRNNQPMLPYPGDGPDPKLRQAQFQYAAWASTSTGDIIQPLFHVTVPNKGDQWTKPGAQILQQVFNPATFKGDLNALPKDQRDAVMQYRREQQKLLNEQKKQNRGTRPPPGGGRGAPPGTELEGDQMYAPRPRNFAPARDARDLPHYAPAPMRPPPYPVRGGFGGPPDVGEFDESMEGYGGGMAQAPGLPQPGTDYPAGEFDPTDTQQPFPWRGKDVEIWAHDDQVVAGKTYRYKVRYRLKNPIFGAANASDPPALAEQFALVSGFSEWTTAMTVPSLVNFFVASSKTPGRNEVVFEIFRWDQGQQKLERFSVGPGDLVGWEKNGIDYSTDWTLVDFRDDPRANDTQILLVNNKDGSVVARSFNTDRNDRLYQALKQQVKAATEAAAAAAAASGGVVPAPNGTAAAR